MSSELSRGVPTATSVLAESVRRYRAGFSGVARAFLPVFAVFAVGQIGLALAGDPSDFGGYVTRALALAGVGVVELVLQCLAMGGLAASRDDLPKVSVASIYAAGAKVFWPTLWVASLVALALSVVPVTALLVTPHVTAAVSFATSAVFGRSIETVVSTALAVVAVAVIAAVAASAALFGKLVFAFPIATSGGARGLASLERSAGLSEGRGWIVGSRLAAGFAALAALAAPFAILVAASVGPNGSAAPWAWGIFVAGYLLAGLPLLVIFLVELSRVLADTAAERALARERRPWVRGFVWAGLAAWGILVLSGLIS